MYEKPRMFVKEDIFINPGSAWRLDYCWGPIQDYAGHKSENLERIKQLTRIFPNEKLLLDTLSRRIKYFNSLNKKMKYFSERYNWNNFPEIYDVYLCHFEYYVSQVTEAIMYVLQFYTRNKKGYSGTEIKHFEDIGKFFVGEHNSLPDYYAKSINDSALLSILLFIRNSLVHDYRNIQYIQNDQDPIVKSGNIPPKKRYGVLNQLYLDHLLKFYVDKKIPSETIEIPDPRFYLNVKLKLTRNCTINYNETIISFSTNTLDFADRLAKKEFFILFRDVLSTLLEENK